MKEVERVPKNGRNEFHGYDFAQEVDILRSVRGKLAELGVLLLTSVESASRQDTLTEVQTVHTFIDAESGEQLVVKGYGQGQDKNDKGGPKAITSALKYALLKNLLIPTGDDPEKDSPESNGRRRAPRPSDNGNREPPPPADSRQPNASTPHQQKEIRKIAGELGLDVDRDILAKMKISWPPDKPTADRILKRLNEKKLEQARK